MRELAVQARNGTNGAKDQVSLNKEFVELGKEIDRVIKGDRKSTRLNSSHLVISYAVFCLKKKTDLEATAPNQPVTTTTNAARLLERRSSSCSSGVATRLPSASGTRSRSAWAPPGVFFNDTATTEIYTLSLHDALPIWPVTAPTAPRTRFR